MCISHFLCLLQCPSSTFECPIVLATLLQNRSLLFLFFFFFLILTYDQILEFLLKCWVILSLVYPSNLPSLTNCQVTQYQWLHLHLMLPGSLPSLASWRGNLQKWSCIGEQKKFPIYKAREKNSSDFFNLSSPPCLHLSFLNSDLQLHMGSHNWMGGRMLQTKLATVERFGSAAIQN